MLPTPVDQYGHSQPHKSTGQGNVSGCQEFVDRYRFSVRTGNAAALQDDATADDTNLQSHYVMMSISSVTVFVAPRRGLRSAGPA
jgi:hypothetical protein